MPLEIKEIRMERGTTKIGPISLTLDRGEIVSICGKNGSGKTSTLAALAGDVRLVSGSVFIDGNDIKHMSIREKSRKIAYIQQEIPEPMSFTVGDIMEIAGYTREGGREAILEALEFCGVEKFIDRDFVSLSGGEKRMVYIASGLYQNADYVMLDEPTSYLDLDRIHSLITLLKGIADNQKGILLVAHDINLAYRISDRIMLMGEGKVIAYGKPDLVINEKILPLAYEVRFGSYDSPEGKRFYPLGFD
jgi:ABC-type cobalamin/Fe3+-siderophores transport systems, ATPase components